MQWRRLIIYLLGRYWEMRERRARAVADHRLAVWIAAPSASESRARDAFMRAVGRRNAYRGRAEKNFHRIGLRRGE